MRTRIWYQSMAPIASLTRYKEALQRHAREVCSEGTEVVFNGVTESRYQGHMPADVLKYTYAKHVLQGEAIDFCRGAERDGFDGAIIGSFSEPFLAETRSILDIPVVSLAESTLLVACSLAEKFALITLAPPNVRRLEKVVHRHGLEQRVSAVLALSNPVDEGSLDRALLEPGPVIEDFRAVARSAIEAGADAVVPAEGVLNELVHGSGVREIGGATILDCVGVTLLYAELLINLKRRMGVSVGRRWTYAKPPPEILRLLAGGQ